MRNIWLTAVLAAAAAACSPGTDNNQTSQDPGKPSTIISDGNHVGDPNANPDFFFLPPLVPSPVGTPNFSGGQFNPNLRPKVTICELNLPYTATESDVLPTTPCKAGGYLVNFPFGGATGVQMHPNGENDWDAGVTDAAHYHVVWKVPNNDAVFYRITTLVGTKTLGIADVETRHNATALQNVNTGQFVPQQDGLNLHIRFRIENNALCTPPGNYSVPCASATIDLASGGSLSTLINNLPAGVNIPPQGGASNPVTFTVQPCGPGGLLIDLPVFGSCLSLTSNPTLTVNLTNPALVFVCDYPPDVSLIPHQQSEMVELHARHSPTFAEALVGADGHCPVSSVQTGSIKGMLASVLRGNWRAARRELVNLIQPEPLMAMFLHAGGGGLTGLQSDFQFALPAKMVPGQDGPLSGDAGYPISVRVKVTDLFGGPVGNANVNFAVLTGGGSVSPASARSDVNGIVEVLWTLGASPGSNTLRAFGVGLATSDVHGPRGPGDFQPHSLLYGCGSPPCAFPAQGFDPFIPKYLDFAGLIDAQVPSPANGTGGVQLQTGAIVFTATGH
jgi:hypothetical protein